MAPVLNTPKDIILFDGVCNFCNSYINYVIAYDHRNKFHFAPLQSNTSATLSEIHKTDFEKLNSIIVVRENGFLTQSKAVLYILKNLNAWWSPLVNVAYLIPDISRNWLYEALAKKRYTLFGRTESCMLPTEEVRSRFLT
ncbi:DUF393 domain-containing protein [Pedobacter sp. HDW13]|uniref:thiol-disulfide oxidoreductase DCC family protein n=1 Tax=unclassified Pedobacter TaxID=2628915 RepID=UPI000F5B75EB|nr:MULTISPECIES: DCC1-like thiol-disulfide oxidoreductase family protein [unclassified Pedobacter]QIL38619.1 DUF393 domain-containing protein [Pedobacter sp. HDW13]RQO78730.1 hypothetical protein DBR40_05575 [Pedobacter sp. KBW01]